jgi:hypothetical protein
VRAIYWILFQTKIPWLNLWGLDQLEYRFFHHWDKSQQLAGNFQAGGIKTTQGWNLKY